MGLGLDLGQVGSPLMLLNSTVVEVEAAAVAVAAWATWAPEVNQ